MNNEFKLVVFADDCAPCECCDDVICPVCAEHYSDCDCPGPTQDGIEFREIEGKLYGRIMKELGSCEITQTLTGGGEDFIVFGSEGKTIKSVFGSVDVLKGCCSAVKYDADSKTMADDYYDMFNTGVILGVTDREIKTSSGDGSGYIRDFSAVIHLEYSPRETEPSTGYVLCPPDPARLMEALARR